MKQHFICETEPLARKENVVQGEGYRITAITGRLIRFEYDRDNCFEDRATQTVWFRDLGSVPLGVERKDGFLEIRTDALVIRYDEKEFSEYGLSVSPIVALRSGDWYYGKECRNLGGTARTLDTVNGATPIEDGILSFDGYAVLDDAGTLVLDEDGWVSPRSGKGQDFYLFAYGHDYQSAVRDYYRLTGPIPMIPRFALGNWWSRYYRYTEDSYKELMCNFEKEEVPFTVAVIDMDWHLVDVDPKYGSGWTGYTWNRELFPDPEGLLSWLHEHGMKTTLNLHPAQGVRNYEEMYPQMAEAMGIDPASGEPVKFQIENQDFLNAYFDILHHPMEEQGVDFWWIDWQQGTHTEVKGLDPLWMLNHYHYLDNARDGKRPLIFSRYAGPGSHRYPIGFSGDTHITWDSLQFQPYFTYTASNIGYSWWSHDIGGHMLGERSDVLEARWYQFGVFSPINRLHSSNSEFSGKEPWNFRGEVRETMDKFLRLRHQMIPYLYTMNYLTCSEGLPIVRPMYYEYPENMNAYPFEMFAGGGYRNQYLFGTQMMVAPIVTDLLPASAKGCVKVWIPEGIWHDFFTGLIYRGERCMDLYRGLDSIPVLVRAGGIVPLTDEIFGDDAVKNPQSLRIRVYGGADGRFTLYEDDNETNAYRQGICVKTDMEFDWENSEFLVCGAKGNTELIPEKRSYTVDFMGVGPNEPIVSVNGKRTEASVSFEEISGCIEVKLPPLESTAEVRISFEKPLALNDNHVQARVRQILLDAQISFANKESVYYACSQYEDSGAVLSRMSALGLEEDVYGAISEVLTAAVR